MVCCFVEMCYIADVIDVNAIFVFVYTWNEAKQ